MVWFQGRFEVETFLVLSQCMLEVKPSWSGLRVGLRFTLSYSQGRLEVKPFLVGVLCWRSE